MLIVMHKIEGWREVRMKTLEKTDVVKFEGRSTARLSPPTQMREMLAASRKSNVPFEHAWVSAFAHVRWPHDTTHRNEWKDELEASKEDWRQAYERQGKPNRALMSLYALLCQYGSDDDRTLAA